MIKRDKKIKKEGSEKRIGLFGGTFNPIHQGHLRGAEEIREAFRLERVIFIPSSVPPHKPKERIIEAKHRLEMVRLATSSNPRFSASEVELLRPGKSYSIDTIRYFLGKRLRLLYFILGKDAFMEIEAWKEFQNLFSICHVIVMARSGFHQDTLPPKLPKSLAPHFRYVPRKKAWVHTSGHHLYFKEISFLDISSTKIRKLIQKGESVRYLIPGEVEGYIQKHRLYQKGHD